MRTNLIFLCLCLSVGILLGFGAAVYTLSEIEADAEAEIQERFALIESDERLSPELREIVAEVAEPVAEIVGAGAVFFAETKVFLFFSMAGALIGVAVWATIMLAVRFFSAVIGVGRKNSG